MDLNPHQVDAALFAFRSPLSKGALLADEVGLGKTIEAGLVLAQNWAERKRRLLVIVPSNLRKQWHQELTEKFFLPCEILETKSYNQAIRQGIFRPFERTEAVVICSYQFARGKAADVASTPWDLVVIDEAHRLRNVYKPANVIANTLKGYPGQPAQAPAHRHAPAELTAGALRPRQCHRRPRVRRPAELPEQFSNLNQGQVFDVLKKRLEPICTPHASAAGDELHPLHETHAAGRGVHAGGERRPALRPRL